MSEFETLADLFPADRKPTRELEPIQKVDRTDQIQRDIDEFHETESAKRVLRATADIIANTGVEHRFRYVHATFGSGKSHLLKLIGVATGELEGLEEYAHDLANTTTGFKQFRDAIADSHIDHLEPLFLNLLDRDRDDTKLPLILFEELGRRRGYHTSLPWLLEFCWQLDIEHGLWEQLATFEHENLQLADVVDRPASLRPWLQEAIPRLDGATEVGLDTAAAVDTTIDAAEAAIAADTFTADDLVERLKRTKRHLQQDGETHQFLIGLDEIAIYVGDQQQRYEEVVETIEALREGLNPPILGTGQWPMRDMQQNFIGEVDEDAWYAQEVELEGADTETIVRKRWLQKSDAGGEHIDSELLTQAPELNPTLTDDAAPPDHDNPAEAYPFRDLDLWLMRDSMQGLIEGDRDTDRDYIQGRALLARVRSLFVNHGWATRSPGVVVPWDEIYDIIKADTELISGWATDLINRVANTLDDTLAVRTAKALFLLSQVGTVPRTAENLARLLVDDVTADLDELSTDVETQLKTLAERNLIRQNTEGDDTTYTILSEEDIQFWQKVQQTATELPTHQVQNRIQEFIQEADPTRLPEDNGTKTGSFGDVEAIPYTVRYSIDKSIQESVSDAYDTIVIRLLVHDEQRIDSQRREWQETHSGPSGREDVLITVELTEALRRQIRQLIGMKKVFSKTADPNPEHQLQQQSMQEEVEDELRTRLNNAAVYLPQRETTFGTYLEALDNVVTTAVAEKFPNRKHIEHTLQIEDLQELIDFFQDDGSWPLSKADANRLGVNRVPRTISNGWAMEFMELDRFNEDDNRVSGDRVLEVINSRGGPFLGTPAEALQTLLFVLIAANRIAIRVDGERITDTRTIARTITSATRFRDAIVVFDPSPPPEDLTDVYAALVGEEPDTDDTQELLDGLAEWANEHASEFKTVVSEVNLKFESNLALETLETALEPAFSGHELDAALLTNEQVIEEAERYATATSLFIPQDGESKPFWERYTAVAEWMSEQYQTAAVTGQLSSSRSTIRGRESLEPLLEEANEYRIQELQRLYHNLSGTTTTTDDRHTLCEELTDILSTSALAADIERVVDVYPKVELSALTSMVESAQSATSPLTEAEFADSALQSDAKTLSNGRALLETEQDGDSLYDQLVALNGDTDENPTDFVLQQISRAVSGANVPDVERAHQLLTQGHRILEGREIDDEGIEQVRQRLAGYDDGTIVVIDTEETQ